MKFKIILLFIMVCCMAGSTRSQSLFYLEYRFTTIEDTTLYHVFLVNDEDGTGFYRVSFIDPYSHSNMIIDLDMTQQYFTDKNGYTDTTKMYFKGAKPQIVAGDPNYHYYPERFWFKLDKTTDLYEPWAVTSPDEKGTAQGKFVQVPELLEQQDLTEDFVSNFFLKDEAFYKSLFTTVARNLTPQERKTQLHLIIVANTEDETIGPSCVLDKDRNLKTFKDLAEFLKIQLDSKVIFGDSYNMKNVQDAVRSLSPAPGDIVVFYYSGHGFMNKDPQKIYPNIALSNKGFEDALANSLNIEDIYNDIKNKGARLNLVISDCCNNNPYDLNNLSCDLAKTRNSTLEWNIENCKSLFMNNKQTSILMTAAQRGELSTGNGSLGGYFTNQLRTNLINSFGPFHLYPTWEAVLSEAKKNTPDQASNSRCSGPGEPLTTYSQHPMYKIQ